MYGHPAIQRYPFLKPQPNNVRYTEWVKHFAWKPVVTITGNRIWMKTVFKRQRIVQEPVSMKVGQLNQTQYIDKDTLFIERLQGRL